MIKFKDLYNRLPEAIRIGLEGCPQDPVWHPEGSVYNHVKLVFEDVQAMYPEDTDLLLAALFHDLGKIDTTETKPDGRITAYGHEHYAHRYIDRYIHLYDDLNPDVDKIKDVCSQHMKAHFYLDGKLKKPHKRKMFQEQTHFNDIMKFEKSDAKRQENG
jgi:tRNA nucleotidyltransferase (CCA-adding enzyme)